MIWLFGEIWAWVVVGFLVGIGTGWWMWFQEELPPVTEPAVVLGLRTDLDVMSKALARAESDLAGAINARKALEASFAIAGVPIKQLFLQAADGDADDLTVVHGVGPRLATLLNDIGIFHVRQIASWSDADIVEVDSRLGAFKGRIARDNWVEQAQALESGNIIGAEPEQP